MDEVSVVKTTDLLALTVILDHFKQFDSAVKEFLKSSNGIFDISKLKAISIGEKMFGNRRIKEFYNNNKSTVDLINICSDIYGFIGYNYDSEGKLNKNMVNLYEYLLKNKDNTVKITNLLLRVYKLGFDYITFSENIDFTKNEYNAYYDEFIYLDNMYVVPTYKGNDITYKTKDSNYEMKLKVRKNKVYPVKLTLNSLLVDLDRVPALLTTDNTYGKIVQLKNNNQKNYDSLRESINLSLSVEELRKKYEYILNLAEICDDIIIKNKLLTTLDYFNEDILELEFLINKYNEKTSSSNELLSEEYLKSEKEKELKRRKKYYKYLD